MIGARPFAAMLAAALAAGAVSTQAQQLYRWTDDKGRVHITDTPPPARTALAARWARQSLRPSASARLLPRAAAQRDFPVVLYTSPPCKQPCDDARAALNRRGVPFREVQVWDEDSQEQLKKVAGSTEEVPVLTVGRSVQKGYQQDAYDALLDSARYPRAGILKPRAQAAPTVPEDYVAPENRAAVKPAEPVKPEAEPKLGPYAPRFSK